MPFDNSNEEALAATYKDMPRRQAWLEGLEWREMDKDTRRILERRRMLEQEDEGSEYEYRGDEV
jgi:hypothetical protein